MNDPNKAISVNLSSLLSLKAELLRKQHEVKLAKAAQVSAGDHKPQKVVSEKDKPKSNSYKEVSRNEDVKVYEEEDHAQLAKSRRVLEAKSKYYDRMSRSGGNLNSDDNCLVMFNRKRQEEDLDDDDEEPQACSPPGRVSSSSSSSSEDEGNDDDEVEYVDCLGRTRKCLRKVLAEEKKRDKQLAHSMPERIDTTKANWMIDTKGDVEEDQESINVKPRPPGSIFSDDQSTATHHAEQLLNWERKEQENAEKPDVHYQDVFFDEARTHGVGYYAFSTDEEERAKQQRELEEARKATTEEQTRRDELRAKRDSMVAGRVLAAKNRIRARSGLPPISKEDYERELQQKKDESAAEAVERERKEREKKEAIEKAREAEEAERAELRKDYVRDWDKEKLAEESDEEWEYKAERLPMSQAQWNDKQRAERREEFAPLPEPLKRSNFSSIPEPPPMWDIPEQEFSNFNSSKKHQQQQQQFQRRNYTTPSDDIDDDAPSTSSGSRGAAIPPPPGLNDMGPPAAKVSRTQNELERSIEAGLKFLRNCCDKEAITSKASWTAKADY
ncbi:coiled-coil domain-containing protein 174 [Drosophila subobscura]|uniref:coiled-coil domain-containing protein 174 n=1 Tax=Drosophila subobscura TaxID=7241 RepID=UPI00155A62D3|nr:coiled-coil domain-containing protein 174 [Drosophila subobscura]